MGITDDIMRGLRSVFGRERDERLAAPSPSSDLQQYVTPSAFSSYDGGDGGGLLAISQSLLARYADYECLAGDTPVLTLDGPVPIEELARRCEKDPNYQFPVYTWDHAMRRITVGMACAARFVKVAKVYEVELDDGQKFRATGNHQWMLRDGSYAETTALSSGSSLMPLYLSTDYHGYLQYRENDEWHRQALTRKDGQRTRPVYRMVAEWKLGHRIKPRTWIKLNGPRDKVDPNKLEVIGDKQPPRRKTWHPWVKTVLEAKAFIEANKGLAYAPKNHKVVRIRELGDAPVFCLEVPGTQNYAIGGPGGGVFTHNSMDDYPDINCFAEGMMVTIVEASMMKSVPIEKLAANGAGFNLIGFDRKKNTLTTTAAIDPRLTGREADVVAIHLSTGRTLRVTPDHKVLIHGVAKTEYVDAKDLKKGDRLVSMPVGFDIDTISAFLNHRAGAATVTEDAKPDGKATVFDVTTLTLNLVVEGVVCHNSANHYYASDATQPDPNTGRVVWVSAKDDAIRGAADTLLRRRLRLDDEMFSMAYTLVKYGNCVAEGSLVWGETTKPIEDHEPGDMVWTRAADGQPTLQRVSKVFDNGEQDIFKVETRHRSIHLTAEHPILVERDGDFSYVKVKDLACERYPSGGLKATNSHLVFATRAGLGSDLRWANLLPLSLLTKQTGKGSPKTVDFGGETLSPGFARIFGFLLGDGSVTDYQVSFAVKTDEETNLTYEGLLKEAGIAPHRGEDRVVASSTHLCHVLRSLGFRNGSDKKTIPPWVFSLKEECQEAFLTGFMDADGWITRQNGRLKFHYEITSEDMAYQLKALIDGLGYTSGNIRRREPRSNVVIKGRTVIETKPTFALTWREERFDSPFVSESVVSISSAGKSKVYDLEIDAPEHNFVANGLVVHNSFEEVLVTNNGVVGLNYLPPATMRRIEHDNTTLIGYLQDLNGQFTDDMGSLRKKLAKPQELTNSIALFEDWQVVHTRIRSRHRRSPYGFGVADGARWIWKRLILLEDAMLIYKLCLRGDSQIWTPNGSVAIKDLEEGDEVYSYGTDDKLKRTKVVYKKHNGQDTIYRVSSDHRELYANATHPVLVDTVVGQGKGKPKIRSVGYVEVQNLIPGVHRFMTPRKNDDDWEMVALRKPALRSKAKVVAPTDSYSEKGVLHLQKTCGVQAHRIKAFFAGDYELKAKTAAALVAECDLDPNIFELEEHWGGDRGHVVRGISVPSVVDLDFARWFGFMLGDGFVTTRKHKNGYEACNEVGFALGSDDSVNEFYRIMFEKYAPVKHVNDQGGRLGAYSVVSSKFAEFMLLNGFIPGAHNKRIPEWAFRVHRDLKITLLRGFADADAHIVPRREGRKTRYERWTFELCNEALVNDIRRLAMQAGLVVTKVKPRVRKGGHEIDGRVMPSTMSYAVSVSLKEQPISQVIHSVEEVERDDIWDIGVEADEHNFVADGVVVHNTRAPARFAFYIDVTDIPANRVESFLQRAKRDLKKKKFVDPRNGRLNMRYNPLCLSGETLIPQLDGSEKTLLEMVKAHERGEEQWVYSTDVEDEGKLVPGKVAWAGKTRENAQLVRITLDNGKSIKVTPDHKMIRRSGEFAEAQTLKVGDSLMPFRYRVSDKNKGDSLDGYATVYCPKCGKSHYVHRVADLLRGVNTRPLKNIHRHMLTGAVKAEGFASFRDFKKAAIADNHKVAKIEWLDNREDTYTLTIEPAHTFAVSAGIFVKNSNDEDFFLPVRDGKELARVDILSGPDYQAIDDVQYFQRKLHGVLKVPRSWLGQEDATPSRAILSNEDARSARVTLGIQTSLRAGVEKIIRIDMAARGISDPWRQEFDVVMTLPSGIWTLAHMEIQNAIADYASRIEPWVSKDYIRANLLKLTDKDIDLIDKQKTRERAIEMQAQGGGGGFGSFAAAPDFTEARSVEDIGMTKQTAAQLGITNRSVMKLGDNMRRLEERMERKSRERDDVIQEKLDRVLRNDRAFSDRHSDRMLMFEQLRSAMPKNGVAPPTARLRP